jgi:hypothetical protein
MNFIYDIIVNFKEEAYDFYDWNKNDDLCHIRKIPIIKVSDTDFYNIKNNIVKINNIDIFEYKTEYFANKSVKKIKNAFLIVNDKEALAINVHNNKVYKSRLLCEEEEEILDIGFSLDEEKINYDILRYKKNNFKTRKQQEIEKYILNELDKIKDNDTIEYLYYDIFGNIEKQNDTKYFLKKLIQNDSKYNNQIYNFFKLISSAR